MEVGIKPFRKKNNAVEDKEVVVVLKRESGHDKKASKERKIRQWESLE